MQSEVNESKQHVALGWDNSDGLTTEKLSGLTWVKIGELCRGIIGQNGVQRIAVMTKKNDAYLELRLSFEHSPAVSDQFRDHIDGLVKKLIG